MKKITFFFWDGWLDVSPTLLSMLTYCKIKGYEVDFFIKDNKEYELKSIQEFKSEEINFHTISTKNIFSKTFLFFVNKIEYLIKNIKSKFLIKLLYQFIYQLNYISKFIELKKFEFIVKKNKKNFTGGTVIFVDSLSTYLVRKHVDKFDDKFYLSLEILGRSVSKFDWFNYLIKKNETEFLNNHIDLIIIQDEIRLLQFVNTLNLNRKIKSFFLPNSIFKDDFVMKSDFFREKFNISSEIKILLSAGMISEYVSSYDIAKVMGSQKEFKNIVTIFHNRIKDDYEEFYLNKILEVSNSKVFLSLDPVHFNDLFKIYSSVDIGLVIYNSKINDLNYTEIGSASGKLFQFAKFGIPVIASNIEGLKSLVKKYKLGVIIDSVEEIPNAINEINNNYEFYSNSSKEAFDNHLCINEFLSKLF